MLGRVVLIAICAALYSPPTDAQRLHPLDACADHPTLAEELNPQAQTEQIKLANETPKLRVAGVTFEGDGNLPEAVKEKVIRELDEATNQTISDLIQASAETIRDAFRNQGYFYTDVTVRKDFLSEAQGLSLRLAFQISEGLQYRLAEIQFVDARVFPASELRKQFPIQDGDIFSLIAIRKGLESLSRLYGSRGYINAAASPDIAPNKKDQQASMMVNMDEGQQFRVGSVEVLGLDRQFWGPTLKNELVPGQIFNYDLIGHVFAESKSALPADASRNDLEIHQDARNATVAIVFDFRRCQ